MEYQKQETWNFTVKCKVSGLFAVGKMGLDTAVHRAVDECIQEGILEEFLRQRTAEVEAVSIFEYDKEEEERKLVRQGMKLEEKMVRLQAENLDLGTANCRMHAKSYFFYMIIKQDDFYKENIFILGSIVSQHKSFYYIYIVINRCLC